MADSSKKEKELGGRKMSTGTKIVVGIFAGQYLLGHSFSHLQVDSFVVGKDHTFSSLLLIT